MNHPEITGRRCCIRARSALCFLILLLLFSAGLILGAVFSAFLLSILPAVIAFAAAIAAGVIVLIIYCARGSR